MISLLKEDTESTVKISDLTLGQIAIVVSSCTSQNDVIFCCADGYIVNITGNYVWRLKYCKDSIGTLYVRLLPDGTKLTVYKNKLN